MFGVTVNHFSRPDHPISIRQSTKFALSLLKNCQEVTTIYVIDSSEEYDPDLAAFCQSIGVNYRHYGRVLSFSEAYNYGVDCLNEDWIVTMASDIYVQPNTFALFKQFIENNPNLPIGCLIPYLSSCDYAVQEASANSVKNSCYPGVMTYNLNVFPKAVFQRLGGLSSKYSGNFNDIETSIQLKDMNLKIILVNTFAHHYGRLTLHYGSNVKGNADVILFQQNRPEFLGDIGKYQVRLDQFLDHPTLKLLFRLSLIFRPRRYQKTLENWVYRKISTFQKA